MILLKILEAFRYIKSQNIAGNKVNMLEHIYYTYGFPIKGHLSWDNTLQNSIFAAMPFQDPGVQA